MTNLKSFTGIMNLDIVESRYTAVEPIPFRTVCRGIREYAFEVSELPVIISLEVHCCIEQQKKMVEVSSLDLFLSRSCGMNLENSF
jgi:Phosphatidylinositol-specific phospholipase C, X domain